MCRVWVVKLVLTVLPVLEDPRESVVQLVIVDILEKK